ncbi:MAG TPA: SGNH/GDSL hydrolase family protein [Streptosporangiaceae bacterium]
MPSRPKRRRSLAVAALAVAVFAGSALATESGLARQGAGPAARTLPAITVRTAHGWHHHHHGEAELCRVIPRADPRRPLIVVLGASYTAGVGAPSPAGSWAVRLAELLRWRAVTLGVPGAGYTAPGDQDLGPLAHELRRVNVRSLRPSVVVIQAGHDDWLVPPAVEARSVTSLVRRLMSEAPHARLVFLTVFSRPGTDGSVLARERGVDAVIGSAVRKTDPRAVVIDPLREHWRFPRFAGGLHPDAHGHLLIAEWIARALVQDRAVTGAATRPGPASVRCTHL